MALVRFHLQATSSYAVYINPARVTYVRSDSDATGIYLAGGPDGQTYIPVNEPVQEVVALISAELNKR